MKMVTARHAHCRCTVEMLIVSMLLPLYVCVCVVCVYLLQNFWEIGHSKAA